jgi:hypothetical protein
VDNEWVDGFLKRMIQNAYKMLKNGGAMLLNVADVPSMPTLTANTMRLALEVGFTYEASLPLYIRATNGNQRQRYEPIFVFRKTT